MVARIEGKLFDEEGLLTFKVLEPIEVESMVDDASKDTYFSVFNKGAKIQGYPAQLVIVKDEKGVLTNLGQQEGVLVEGNNGIFLFPFDSVDEVSSDLLEQVTSDDTANQVQTSLSQLNDKLSSGGLLGFTWKQILLITGVAIVATKVFNK